MRARASAAVSRGGTTRPVSPTRSALSPTSVTAHGPRTPSPRRSRAGKLVHPGLHDVRAPPLDEPGELQRLRRAGHPPLHAQGMTANAQLLAPRGGGAELQ